MVKIYIYCPNMKVYKRYFIYGSIITSLMWAMSIYLYTKMDNIPSSLQQGTAPESSNQLKLKSKYSNSIKHNDDFDRLYGHNLHNDRNADSQENQIKLRGSNEHDLKDSGNNFRQKFNSGVKYNLNNDLLEPKHYARKVGGADRALRKKEKYKNEVLQVAVGRVDELAELGIVRNSEDQKAKDEGEALYAFNLLISDRLSFNRDIPDTRHADCKTRYYPKSLPSASIVICFHNEAFSALMRTVHSVMSRTPEDMLHEVILIDDSSTLDHLKTELEEYIAKKFVKVKLFRTDKREGLIRARILGGDKATGEVLVFLDSHCEVNKDWIQPLLVSIQEDPTSVPIPVIDIINQDTFNYEASPLVRGGFNWGMHFRWDSIPQSWWRQHRSPADPIP